jgi:uncharacterized protein (TIGR02246 family)
VTDDIVVIQQLLNRYCHVLDRGDVDAVGALFADDAVLLPEYEGAQRHEGRAAIRVWYTRYCERSAANVRSLRHKISTAVIDVDGDRATAVCYLDADSVSRANGARTFAGGRYEDVLVKRGGAWLLSQRRIVVDSISTLAAG